MTSAEVLLDAFGRIRALVHGVVEDLTPAQLELRLDPAANSITWLVWHLTRIQDDHVGDLAARPQLWTSAGWAERFGLPSDPGDTGYGHSAADVETVSGVSGDLLTGYYDAVHDQTIDYVKGVSDPDLDRIVDDSWDPPVTLGVRLVSVVGDDLEHVGQAAFIRGVALRR